MTSVVSRHRESERTSADSIASGIHGTAKRLGRTGYTMRRPDRLDAAIDELGELRSRLHMPTRDPGCLIPPDNSGAVHVLVAVDPKTGQHRLRRAWAVGGPVDHDVLSGCIKMVLGWSCDPPRFADGTLVASRLEGDEVLTLEVRLPIGGDPNPTSPKSASQALKTQLFG